MHNNKIGLRRTSMTEGTQGLIAILLVGLIVGGIAAAANRGKWLIAFIVVSIAGSFFGGALLTPLLDVRLVTGEFLVTTIIQSIAVSIVFVVVLGIVLGAIRASRKK
jgi:uncharacterized membrane protein YeaQ/YmgE (transglycosylase-associated protein family)